MPEAHDMSALLQHVHVLTQLPCESKHFVRMRRCHALYSSLVCKPTIPDGWE